MSEKLSLSGNMIPRQVRRTVDERLEPRHEAQPDKAVLGLRGQDHLVRLVNLSDSGAMVIFGQVPHIGEAVTLQLLDQGLTHGHVRWVRDGRIGIHFVASPEVRRGG